MKLIRRLHANVYHSLYQAGAPQWSQILAEVAIIYFFKFDNLKKTFNQSYTGRYENKKKSSNHRCMEIQKGFGPIVIGFQ